MSEVQKANELSINAECCGLVPTNTDLNTESVKILNQLIQESDEKKVQDLTYLFNQNQAKKTLVRVDKLSELQDGLVNQFSRRITERPDQISNKELMDGIRIVQDIIERGTKQANNVEQPPLIQINQQTNSVNLGTDGPDLNRESRERVKNAVLGLLGQLNTTKTDNTLEYVEYVEEETADD